MLKSLTAGAFGLGLFLALTPVAQAKHHVAEGSNGYTEAQLIEDLRQGCFPGNPIPLERCVRNKAQKCTAAVRLMREYKREEANVKREFRECLQDRS